jgi:Rad51
MWKVLKETRDKEWNYKSMGNLYKECPKCGLLVDQDFVESDFIKKKQSSSLLLSPTANSLMIPKFEIAYQGLTERQQHDRVILNMEEVDSFLNLIISDTLLIIGETRFTNLLISRLYVNASLNYSFRSKLQPKKRVDNNSKERVSASVMVIDAGNSTDFYLVINFARQYGLDIKKFLQSVIISRMFTVEQLANTIINQIQKIIKNIYSRIKVIIVINLLNMFINDPNLSDTESRLLIRQILDSLNKISKEFNVLVIVSCTQTKYDKLVSRRFLKTVRISTVNGNEDSLKKKMRLELTVGPRRNIRSIVLQEKDLRTISKNSISINIPTIRTIACTDPCC